MKDYRFTVKVRNNRLLRAIEAAGGNPGPKWCEANGLGYSGVNHLVNMTSGPLTAQGQLTVTAARLCDVLGKLPDELWSNEQIYPVEKNFSELEMDYSQVCALLPKEEQSYLPDYSALDAAKTKAVVERVLDSLTNREGFVMRMLYQKELTHDEVGEQLGVTGLRVRQIEAKALRKLKHPSRMAALVDCVDLDAPERARIKAAAA